MSVSEKYWSQGEEWPWQPHEVELLTNLYPRADTTFRSICDRLSRSRGSVSGKARTLGLKRPTVKVEE